MRAPYAGCDDHLRRRPGPPAARRRRAGRWSRSTTTPPASAPSCRSTTYANWVAKTASLLAEELDLERGQAIRIDLPDALAGPGVPRRRLDGRAGRRPQDDAADAVVCGPDGLDAGPARAARRAGAGLARCTRSASGSPSRCRPACTTSASEVWSQPDAFVAVRPAGRRRPRRSTGVDPGASCGTRPPPGVCSPTAAASSPRTNPASPPGTRLLHRAARTRRLAGPGRPRRPGAARGDVRRRARHGPLPLTAGASAGQVVAAHPLAEEPRGREPGRRRRGSAYRSPVAFWRTIRSGWPLRPTSLTPITQSYGVRSTASALRPVKPPGPLPR